MIDNIPYVATLNPIVASLEGTGVATDIIGIVLVGVVVLFQFVIKGKKVAVK